MPPATSQSVTNARTGVRPRPFIAEVRPYTPRNPSNQIDLWLDANEGAAPHPQVLMALGDPESERIRRYPRSGGVERRLAAVLGRRHEEVLVTGGADDAIDRCCRAMLEPGRQIVIPVPSFEMIGRYAHLAGGEVVEVSWPDEGFPTDDLIERFSPATAVIAIVTPNNPTGLTATTDQVMRVASAAPRAMVVVDLAYTEFADLDITSAVLQAPNVIAIRTFSKAHGLAGLRLGFAVGPQRLIGWLRAAGGPFSASSTALVAAEAVLDVGMEIDQEYLERIRGERCELRAALLAQGFDCPISQANFVYARRGDALEVQEALARRGIAVRGFAVACGGGPALRITCPGNDGDFNRLLRDLNTACRDVQQ